MDGARHGECSEALDFMGMQFLGFWFSGIQQPAWFRRTVVMARGSSSPVREGEGNQDLASLHAALQGERDRLVSELDQIRAERDAALEQVAVRQQEVDRLQAKLEQLLRRAFDRSSEKLHPDQLRLFAEKGAAEESEAADPSPPAPEELAADDESAEEAPPPSKPRKPRKEKQPRLAADAESEVIEHPVEDMTCACGAEMVSIGAEESEEIEYVPARFKKIIHRRHKAACPACQENVVRAPAPSRVMWKCLPGVTLATWILVSKYKDHVPLHRLSGIFARLGAHIPRSTLCEWVMKLAGQLQPIVHAMKEEILKQDYVGTDDTPVKAFTTVQGKRQRTQAYLWPYLAADQVVFDFTRSRSRDGPEEFLKEFRGFLQSDDYAGYRRLQARDEIVGVGCMAHARRKFHEAIVSKAPVNLVLPVIACIKRLYDIEAEARAAGGSPFGRFRLRYRESRPILAVLLKFVRQLEKDPRVLPQSALGTAVAYMLRNWRPLRRFTSDGRLEIDNNRVERCIRPVALGRKNWLFAGSERGGRAAAWIYSLVESCNLIGVPVERYLKDVLGKLAHDPNIDPRSLTPKRWKESASSSDPAPALDFPS